MSICPSFSFREKSKYLLAITALVLLAGVQVIHDTSQFSNRAENLAVNSKGYLEKTKCSTLGCTNITELQGWELPWVEPEMCLKTSKLGRNEIESFMCLKSVEEDEVISGVIMREGMFEPASVGITSDIAHIYPEATFIDIGANIGTHSLAALANGCKVVSVEPIPRNLAFISQSAYFMNKRENIRYLQNAVSNTSETLYVWKAENNDGGYKSNGGNAAFHNKEQIEKLLKNGKNVLDMSVKSVRLEEIMDYINPKVAFIKVDAEGKDCMVNFSNIAIAILVFSMLLPI